MLLAGGFHGSQTFVRFNSIGIPMHWYSCSCSLISSLCLSVGHVDAVERLVGTPYSKFKLNRLAEDIIHANRLLETPDPIDFNVRPGFDPGRPLLNDPKRVILRNIKPFYVRPSALHVLAAIFPYSIVFELGVYESFHTVGMR